MNPTEPWYSLNKPWVAIIFILGFIAVWALWKTVFFLFSIFIYFSGTTTVNFWILFSIFCLLCFLLRYIITKSPLTFLPKLVIVYAFFFLINIMPLPIPGYKSLGESFIPNAIGIGWPIVMGKYYLGEGDYCPGCVEKEPIHAGSVQLHVPVLIPNTMLFTIFVLPITMFLLRNKK